MLQSKLATRLPNFQLDRPIRNILHIAVYQAYTGPDLVGGLGPGPPGPSPPTNRGPPTKPINFIIL